MTIWKFPLELTDRQIIGMPRGAKVLSVQVQHGVICLWAAVNGTAVLVPRTVSIAGTGHDLPAGEHVGSVQMKDGLLVFHVFVEQEGAQS